MWTSPNTATGSVQMDEVRYEEEGQHAILQSDHDDEWLASDAVVELDAWQ